MSQFTFSTRDTYTANGSWKTPARVLHWLIAASMGSAAFLTSHGDIGHATLGWVALGGLLIRRFVSSRAHAPSLMLWPVTAGVVVLNLSGFFAAYSTFHLGATLVVLVIAAFYCATILFESLQRITAHWFYPDFRDTSKQDGDTRGGGACRDEESVKQDSCERQSHWRDDCK